MSKFQEIVKYHKDNIYGGGYKAIPSNGGTEIYLYLHDIFSHTKTISINDLLSHNSGFMQAVKWRSKEKCIEVDPIYYDGCSESNQYLDSQREYHSFKLSIIPDEGKIQYLEENVIID